MKLCVTLLTLLLAFSVMLYTPPVPAAGVPESTPAELSVTPLGKAPASLKVGVGVPEAVAVKLPAVPTAKVVLLALVNAGATSAVPVPVPLTGISCVAVSTTSPFSAVLPPTVGSNSIASVHDSPESSSVSGQLLPLPRIYPVGRSVSELVKVSGAWPMLSKVTVCSAVVLPKASLPKFRVGGSATSTL